MVINVLCKLSRTVLNVLLVVLITFLLQNILPSDPARVRLGVRYTEHDAKIIRREYGLDQPVFKQFAIYLNHVAHGDFGSSTLTGESIGQGMGSRGKVSLLLVLNAVLLVMPWVALAVILATKKSVIADFVDLVLLSLSIVPVFVTSVILIVVAGKWLDLSLLATPGAQSAFPQYLTAASVLSFYPSLVLFRIIHGALRHTMTEPFVIAQIAFGVPRRKVLVLTALKNASLSILSNGTNLVGFFLTSIYVVEAIFGFGGIGGWTVTAAQNYDIPVVLANVLLASFLLNCTSMATSILATLMDPRISHAV